MSKEYRCPTCKRPFDRISSLNTHIRTVQCVLDEHIDKQLKERACPYCGTKGMRIDNLKIHVKKCDDNPDVIKAKQHAKITIQNNVENGHLNNNCNITNNITNTGPVIQLQQNILLYDKIQLLPYQYCPDLLTLPIEETDSVLHSDKNPLLKYFELTHCNLEKPNFLNIYYVNQNYVRVFTEDGWQEKESFVVMDTIMKNECKSLKKYAETTYRVSSDSRINRIKDVIK